MRVTSVWTYPVKSLGGVATDSATVEPWGLAGDRRWALVDPEGDPVTARQVNALLGLRAEPLGPTSRDLRITDRAGETLDVAAPVDAAPVPVGFSRQSQALPADPSTSTWLSERAGRPVRLVWQSDPTARPINPERGGVPGDSMSLADAGPVLVCSEASVAGLNDWLVADRLEAGSEPADPMVVERFRPNVVIDGDEPFAEESWDQVRLGQVLCRATMICDRCVMTTIDPVTLERGLEPIRTLARHHRWDGATWFGVRLVATTPGEVRVGDPVEVVSLRRSGE